MEQQQLITGTGTSMFLQPHSSIIRIWHWLTFILISLIIVTVILNSTLMNPQRNAEPVRNQLKEQGITIDERQAFFLAHHFDDQLWDLHKLMGICIAFLLLVRIAGELFIPHDEKLIARSKYALKLFRGGEGSKREHRHYLAVRWTYMLFYPLLLLIVLTGLTLAFGGSAGVSRELSHTVREIHGTCQWLVYTFVLFHIGGVILADLGKAKGVVSGMINGNKRLP